MTTHAGAVAPAHPPQWVLRVVNSFMRVVLPSPVHGLVGSRLLLLRFSGRRTGRRYAVPAARHVVEGQECVLTYAPWRLNLRGGVDVEVVWRGTARRARADLVEDVPAVVAAYAAKFDEYGLRGSRLWLGVRTTVRRPPTADELAAAVRELGLSIVRLAPR